MAEEKTYVFGNDGGNIASLAPLLSSMNNIPTLMASMMNNGGFGGGNGAWWILILLWALGGNGWNNRGNTDAILSTLNNDTGREMILSAINGNSTAISQLASTLNCNVNALQGAIGQVQMSIQSVGNQVGLSSQQVINAIQSGNCQIANQLAQCCCDVRNTITSQGYENRIATQEQTGFITAKIDYQTNLINDKFCQLEMREMQNKIDTLRETNSALRGQIDNANQTAAITSYVNQIITPIATDVAALKAAAPPTVAVPYPQLSAVPTSYLYGSTCFNNGSIWS